VRLRGWRATESDGNAVQTPYVPNGKKGSNITTTAITAAAVATTTTTTTTTEWRTKNRPAVS